MESAAIKRERGGCHARVGVCRRAGRWLGETGSEAMAHCGPAGGGVRRWATGTRVRDRREVTRRRRVPKLMARAAMVYRRNRVLDGKDIAGSFWTNGTKGLKLQSVV